MPAPQYDTAIPIDASTLSVDVKNPTLVVPPKVSVEEFVAVLLPSTAVRLVAVMFGLTGNPLPLTREGYPYFIGPDNLNGVYLVQFNPTTGEVGASGATGQIGFAWTLSQDDAN